MAYNLEDYILTGVIGPNNECITCDTYSDMWVDARLTKEAYFTSLNGWYLASTCCLVDGDPCLPAIKKLWNELQNFIVSYETIWQEFWASLQCDGVFSDVTCNQYRKAMVDLKCMVRQLLRLVDGDFINTQSIPITTTTTVGESGTNQSTN
jgi:hypothetical protein